MNTEMMSSPEGLDRRALLQSMLGLAMTRLALTAGPGAPTRPALLPDPAPGKPGDFDFLAGQWRIAHRQLKTPGSKEWREFTGEATCWTILGGVGSVEELRFPSTGFSGMGLRLLDLEKRLWSDFWVSGTSGVLTTPGATGGFENGAGTFVADDTDGDNPIKVRGVWDRITPKSCRWHQALSYDGGKHWEENWFMDWVKV